MTALVSCSGPKLAHRAPARRLYTSPLFRAASAHARAHFDRWFILSGLYGLVAPDEELDPYNVDLSTFTKHERRTWGARVARQLRERGELGPFVILAGAAYREPLVPHVHVIAHPTNGLTIGRALQWYRRNP